MSFTRACIVSLLSGREMAKDSRILGLTIISAADTIDYLTKKGVAMSSYDLLGPENWV